MGRISRESPGQAENRYSPIQGGVRGAETWVGSAENRQTRERIGIRRFRGYQCGKDMGRTGRESLRPG